VGIVSAVHIPATLNEIADGIRRVLAAGRPLTEDEVVAALREHGLDLGVDPEVTVADLLEDDYLGLVMPLGDGRHVLLPALLRDRTFTHRVTGAEVEHGFLDGSPDLEPLSILTEDDTYRRLVDGTELVEALPDFDAELLKTRGIPADTVGEVVWLLSHDTLRGLGLTEGGLVGVTVRSDGFELRAVTDAHGTAGLASPLVDALDQCGHGDPAQISDLVWLACADNPRLFTSPAPPLAEAFGAAGLVWDGELVAPPGFEFARWRANRRVGHIASLHRLEHDEALAVLALSSVYEQVATVFDYAQQAVDAGAAVEDLDLGVTGDSEPTDEGSAPDAGDSEDSHGLDRRLVRDMVGFLDSPAVAEALLVETIGAGRDGAAALGLFAETLEPQAPRSARPTLRWLRGKALERMGRVLDAEEAYEAALSLDDSALLALFELARIASDRGDADRGLSLLRRAGAPADDELVVLLNHVRPVERTDIGRNDPCWCGSGRKYKVCHRNKETLPLDERAAWLYQKAGTYLSDGPWRAQVIDVAEVRAAHWDRPDATWLAMQDGLVGDTVLFEGRAFAAFLDERGMLLPDDERLLAEQWLLAERSVHEIETVSPGTGFTARDVRTGDRAEVRERTASRGLKAGDLICARLVPAGETVQCFGGIEPVRLHERDALTTLLDSNPEPEEIVGFLSRRFAPPALQNTEGDALVFCEATLRTDDPDALTALLDATYMRVEGETRWIEHVVTHGMQRIRATLTLDGTDLHLETNSEARIDRLLNTLPNLQPGLHLVTQNRRAAEDAQEAMSRTPAGAPTAALDPSDPQIVAALEQITLAHERAWLDVPIPALADATPREAAADPTRRPDLIRLLDTFGPSGPGAMDADRLRSQLGL